MTRLWTSTGFISDGFIVLDDAAPALAGADAAVSLARWRNDGSGLNARAGKVLVRIEPTTDLAREVPALLGATAIEIPFAKFSDGRGYSLARSLRDEYHFKGELRASGEILLDQLPLLLRVGFDTFAVSHRPTLAALEVGQFPAIAEVYQAAADTGSRHRRRVPVALGA